MTSETGSLTNGINDINVITKVTEQAAGTFTMNYYERSGSIITKTHELYLRGIKDPRTQIKRYNGLIQNSFAITQLQGTQDPTVTNGRSDVQKDNKITEKGYHMEVFHFLLIITDNTGLNLEKAYLLASCQPTTANTNIYNVTRGDIGFSELQLSYNGFPISGRIVNYKATQFIDWINKHTCFDEMSFGYDLLSSENLDTKSIENRNGVYSPTIADDGSYKYGSDSGTTRASANTAGYGSIYGYSPYSGNAPANTKFNGSGTTDNIDMGVGSNITNNNNS